MSRREKLVNRLLSLPNDFHYSELVKVLSYYGFEEVKIGKTSGSRVKFVNKNNRIQLHKPHPSGILKTYQLKQIVKDNSAQYKDNIS